MIDSAPFFLGLFARIAGIRQERLRRFSAGLEVQVAEKTESLRRALAEAQRANDVIAHMAEHDALTGLLNRRRFEQELRRWADHSLRYRRPLALLFLDLDDFKQINDRHGHKLGDRYLAGAADALTAALRSSDAPPAGVATSSRYCCRRPRRRPPRASPTSCSRALPRRGWSSTASRRA